MKKLWNQTDLSPLVSFAVSWIETHLLTVSVPAAVTNSCRALTDRACSMTNTHCDRSGGMFLSAIFSRKQCRLPKPSAAKHTRSPVAVQDRHTISSCNRKSHRMPLRNWLEFPVLPFARMKHHPARNRPQPPPLFTRFYTDCLFSLSIHFASLSTFTQVSV